MSQFAFPAVLTESAERSSVVAFNPEVQGAIHMADSTHPNWTQILFGLRSGDRRVWELFDIAGGIVNRFNQISERYSWDGTTLLYDFEPVSGPFEDLLVRSLQEGNADNYTALAKFGEKVAQNPSENSRQQLFRFLSNHRFQITPDGDVVAYKRVESVEGGTYRSNFRSQVPGKPSAYVNGKAIAPLSSVPQAIGDVVTMPRHEVNPDPNNSCSRGLHVATVQYWGGFVQGVLEVHANPRDFVAVPNGEDAKARVCRYYVARVAKEPDGLTVVSDAPTYQWAGDVGTRL